MVILTASSILTRARVAHLEDVIKLNVWGCSLTDIDVVANCHNIQILSASCNDVTSLKELASCTKLHELYIRENQITDIQEIFHLTKLTSLKVLWLAGNPCCQVFGGDEGQYRLFVLRHLPNLERLDNTEVQQEEKKRARTFSGSLDAAPAPAKHDSVLSTVESDHGSHRSGSITREAVSVELPSASDPSTISSRSGFNEATTELVPSKLKRPAIDKIRTELPVAPLYPSHAGQSDSSALARLRNVNILSAALALVKELDQDSLNLLQCDISQRLKDLQSRNA